MAVHLTCARCKTDMWLPDDLHSAARKSPDITFYCPYGHTQHYPAGETEEVKLRRERDRLQQRLAEKDDEIAYQRQLREEVQKTATARKGVITRLKNRASAGVCPCCNRTVSQMARHMATKHPGFKAEEVA